MYAKRASTTAIHVCHACSSMPYVRCTYLDVGEEGEHDGDRHARKERVERDHREGGERGAGERGERVVEGPRGSVVGYFGDGQAEGRAEKAAEGGRR